MAEQPNQFYRGSKRELVTIPLTNSTGWLKERIEYAETSAARARHPDAKKQWSAYAAALKGALQLKLANKQCPVCGGKGYVEKQ